jgi:hypothetical protein
MNPRYFDAMNQLGVDPGAIDDVFDAVDFGVFVDQVEQGCIYASREALRMFEMDWETLRTAVERYERDKTWIEVEYRITVPNGELRAIHVMGKAICDKTGAHLGSVIIDREVTYRRTRRDRSHDSIAKTRSDWSSFRTSGP